jgi:hypothetical protein
MKNHIQSPYKLFFVLFTYSLIYIAEILTGINFNNNWLEKSIGTIFGYFFNDIFINLHKTQYNLYIHNLIKFICIFFSQNIILKLFINDFTILSLLNITKIYLYLLIYFFIDIIIDAIIDDQNENKEIYTDFIKTAFGFIIVESLLNRKITNNDYIYLVVLCTGLLFFNKFIDKYIKDEK